MVDAKNYYDRTSWDYLRKWEAIETNPDRPANYFRRQVMDELLKLAKLEPGRRIVEIGCGTGLVLREILKVTRPVFGIDISLEMLKCAKESVLRKFKVELVDSLNRPHLKSGESDVYLATGDFLNLDIPAGFFDVIVSMEVLRYIEDIDRCFANVRNVLPDGGRFVFTITNKRSFSFFPAKFLIRQKLKMVNTDREIFQYFITERSLREKLKKAGLKITCLKRLRFLSSNAWVMHWVRTRCGAEWVDRIDRFLSRFPLVKIFFDTFVVAVEKT